jgi:hypothetical protein
MHASVQFCIHLKLQPFAWMKLLCSIRCIVLKLIILFSKIGEIDFQDSVMTLGFSEELNKLLLQVCFASWIVMKFLFIFIWHFWVGYWGDWFVCSTCKFVTNYRKKNFEAQVTLHNDNDTITCIRAMIGQTLIVIVRLKIKSLGWAILKSLSSNDNFIIFVVVWTPT